MRTEAAAAVAVATNVTESTPTTTARRVSLSDPAVVPTVHAATVAVPFPSVIAGLPVTLPSPEAVNVTEVPDTGLLNASVTEMAGSIATAVPTVAVCPPPALTLTVAATSAVAVATKVTESMPATTALNESLPEPAVVPSVQLVTVATPFASDVAGLPTTVPSPEAVNVTATPETGLPDPSVINTAGGVATAVATVALWPSPALMAALVAMPAVTSNGLLTAGVSPPAVAVSV